jgi:ribose transport system substrate-binding protein
MDKLRILVSLITDRNDYQIEQAAAAKAAAVKCGAQVEITYSGNDAVQQTQQILSFIQEPGKRPDAILVEPVGTGMVQVARAAVSASIAWGIINAEVDYLTELRAHCMVPVFGVTSDNKEIGRIQGRQIAALLGEKGCVLYVEGPSGRDTATQRTAGVLSSKPAGVTLKMLKGDWTEQSAYGALKSWLSLSTSRQLKVGMVACQNDAMAMGARRAFEALPDAPQREEWLRLPLTGCDGVPGSGQAWVREGLLAATVISPPLMGRAVELLADALHSNAQPPERTLVAASSFPALEGMQTKARSRTLVKSS